MLVGRRLKGLCRQQAEARRLRRTCQDSAGRGRLAFGAAAVGALTKSSTPSAGSNANDLLFRSAVPTGYVALQGSLPSESNADHHSTRTCVSVCASRWLDRWICPRWAMRSSECRLKPYMATAGSRSGKRPY